MDKEPFIKEKYTKIEDKYYPLLDAKVSSSDKDIKLLLDTGCTGGIVLLDSQIEGLNLGEKINNDPWKIVVADGHILGVDVYITNIKIKEKEEEIMIQVINTDKIIGKTGVDSTIMLGREYLDNYVISFNGIEKEIIIQ